MAYEISCHFHHGMSSKEMFWYRKHNLNTTNIFWYPWGYDEQGPRNACIIVHLN